MTSQDSPIGSVPPNGHAVIEGPSANLTIDWNTFGTVTDLQILGATAPMDVIAGDDGHVSTVVWTIREMATALSSEGIELRFFSDWRADRLNALADAIVAKADFSEGDRFVMMRAKVVPDRDRAVPAEGALPAVEQFAYDEHAAAYDSLYEATLAKIPQRGVTTLDGVRRQIGDPEFATPELYRIADPGDASSFIATAALSITASSPQSPAIGEISLLAVDPSWQRKGVGRQLVSHLLHVLSSRDIRTALTYVDADNTAAMQLLESSGFRERAKRVYFT